MSTLRYFNSGGVRVQAPARRDRRFEALGKSCRARHGIVASARREAHRVLRILGLSLADVLGSLDLYSDEAEGVRCAMQEGGRPRHGSHRGQSTLSRTRVQCRALDLSGALAGD